MTLQSDKLKFIYKPFLLIAIGMIVGYTVLNWIVFKKLHIISLNDDVINFWIPAALPWIPILRWLRPRIKLLNLKSKRGDLPFLYIFIAGLAIAIPTVVAQNYLESASGVLTRLDNINLIEKQPATKYYSLKSFYIDKNNIGVQTAVDVSGKNNQYLNMSLFIVLPILGSSTDTATEHCLAWYGIKYHKQISNRLNGDEKEEGFRKFSMESQENFDKKEINQFVYFDRIGNNEDHKNYISAIRNEKKYSGNSTTVLIPVNEPFEARNGNKLAWIFGAFGIGAIIWLVMLLIPKFNQEALSKLKLGETAQDSDITEMASLFLPRKAFYITPIIMDLNIVVFVVMVFSGLGFISFNPADLLNWGANYRPVTSNGQWWRLLTSTFLHGGLIHLLANIYGLLFVGIFLEPRLGKAKYAAVYLTTGVLASLASLYFHKPVVSVGASGAIFGLYGVFLALLFTKIFPKDFSKTFLTSTLIFIGYNLLMGFLGTGSDNTAHLGGLASGFIIGLILYPQLKRQDDELLILSPVETKINE